MDVHIHMSYCTPSAFKILAINYLCITHHKLFAQIDPLIDEAEVTPAEVAEQLMKHDDPDSALEGLIEFLKLKKFQNDEAKAKKLEEAKAKKLEDETKSSSKDQNDDENNGKEEVKDGNNEIDLVEKKDVENEA